MHTHVQLFTLFNDYVQSCNGFMTLTLTAFLFIQGRNSIRPLENLEGACAHELCSRLFPTHSCCSGLNRILIAGESTGWCLEMETIKIGQILAGDQVNPFSIGIYLERTDLKCPFASLPLFQHKLMAIAPVIFRAVIFPSSQSLQCLSGEESAWVVILETNVVRRINDMHALVVHTSPVVMINANMRLACSLRVADHLVAVLLAFPADVSNGTCRST